MKKLLSIVVMVLLGVSSVWAKIETVEFWNGENNYLSDFISITPSGITYSNNIADFWRGAYMQMTPNYNNDAEGSLTFSVKDDFTRISTYSFWIHPHYNGTYKVQYAINDGEKINIKDGADYEVADPNYLSKTFKLTGYANGHAAFLIFSASYYYLRTLKYKFNVIIPEVVDRTTTSITVLDKIEATDLQNGDNTRSGMIPFVVKDPIDTDNPQIYFAASIQSKTGETWSIANSGWQCIDNTPANRETYNVDDETDGSKILLVPVTYTATNGTTGTFKASIKLTSRNKFNTKEDIQEAQITVAEKEEYPISWGNSWEDGSEINLFKGKTYPRTGAGGYLANTDGFESILETPEVENVNPTTPASPIVSFDAQGKMTLHQEGKVKLTYTQPAMGEYKEKVLTLTINVIKQTPEFTLHFRIYKFRTMVENAEASGVPQVTHDNDPRITRVGHWLRKYRLDELPQLWNILRGDMSIVGPRPERPYFVEQIMKEAPYYCLLYKVRPGLTSWGPIRVGYTDTMEKMIERLNCDVVYVENMSLLLDMKILFFTVGVIVKGKGK